MAKDKINSELQACLDSSSVESDSEVEVKKIVKDKKTRKDSKESVTKEVSKKNKDKEGSNKNKRKESKELDVPLIEKSKKKEEKVEKKAEKKVEKKQAKEEPKVEVSKKSKKEEAKVEKKTEKKVEAKETPKDKKPAPKVESQKKKLVEIDDVELSSSSSEEESKDSSESSEDVDSSEEEKKPLKKKVVVESSSEESSEEEVVVKSKKIVKEKEEAKKPVATKKKVVESSSSEDESSEEEVVVKKPAQVPSKKVVAKESSSSEDESESDKKDSSESSEEESEKSSSESEEEKVVPQKKLKVEDDLVEQFHKEQNQKQQARIQPATHTTRNGEQQFEIFIGQLNFNSTEQDIKNFFKGCGNVSFVKLLKNDDGRSKGRGFVKFTEEAAIHKAMELQNHDFMGRPIKIEIPREREANASPRPVQGRFNNGEPSQENKSVIVRNIPFNYSEDQLQLMFEGCGKIRSVRIIKNEEGQSRGFGFVDFLDVQYAKQAISKTGEKINGRAIHVDFSQPRENRGGERGGNFRGGDRQPFQRSSQPRNDTFQGEIVDL